METLEDLRSDKPWYVDLETDVYGTFFIGEIHDACVVIAFEEDDDSIVRINKTEVLIQNFISYLPLVSDLLCSIAESPDTDRILRKKINDLRKKIENPFLKNSINIPLQTP